MKSFIHFTKQKAVIKIENCSFGWNTEEILLKK
jgi:hypothetical protein